MDDFIQLVESVKGIAKRIRKLETQATLAYGGGGGAVVTGNAGDIVTITTPLILQGVPILPASKGGTGINNGVNNLTVPATGIAALLATKNVFVEQQKIHPNADADNILILKLLSDNDYPGQILFADDADAELARLRVDRNFNISLGLQAGNSQILADAPANRALMNIFIGSYSGKNVEAGDYNTAIGYNTLSITESGNSNVALGVGALQLLDIGYDNIALGNYALSGLGSNEHIFGASTNIGIGMRAGQHLSSNPNDMNARAYLSIYIGRDTTPTASNHTNEIIIGDTAVGNGSHTVTLGNDNVTDTFLKGIVHIADAFDAATKQPFTAISNPPTQAEVTAIRDALINLGLMDPS